jgi:hypothetical protein
VVYQAAQTRERIRCSGDYVRFNEPELVPG